MSATPTLVAQLNADQVAELLGVKREHVYDLIRERDLPHVRMGSRVLRFDPAEVEEWRRANVLRSSDPR